MTLLGKIVLSLQGRGAMKGIPNKKIVRFGYRKSGYFVKNYFKKHPEKVLFCS